MAGSAIFAIAVSSEAIASAVKIAAIAQRLRSVGKPSATGAAADFAARGSVNMIIAPNCADRIKLSASNRSEAVPYFAQRPWQDLPVCIDADLATFQSSCAGALCTTVEVRAAMPRKERALCVLQAS
jgi:hypothetical protein